MRPTLKSPATSVNVMSPLVMTSMLPSARMLVKAVRCTSAPEVGPVTSMSLPAMMRLSLSGATPTL